MTIKDFDSGNIKIDEKSCKNLKYVKINSVSPSYLMLNKVNRYFQEINDNKYLKLVPTNETKNETENKKKHEELWNKIRYLMRLVTKKSDNYDEKRRKIKLGFCHY